MPGTRVLERIERQALKVRSRAMAQPGERPDPSRPAGTDLIPQIKHIVVLMMENHSFDNYLGTLAGRGEGLPLAEDGTPEAENPDASGQPIRAYRMPSTVQQPGRPCQSWCASHTSWAGGKMDGFVRATQDTSPSGDTSAAMGYWTEKDLPFYHGLARTFPLLDHWFCSCLGPTFPNRRFLLAGTAHGLMDDLPVNILDRPPAGTILDSLTRHGISWANYRPDGEDESAFRSYVRYKRRRIRHHLEHLRVPFRPTPAFRRDLQCTIALYPLGMARHMLHVHSMGRFFADADAGTLPSFCIVDPDFEQFSEENPQDIRKGESFAAEVINRLMHGKGWPETLLIWTYDEHGGYYDHVAPPAAVPPDDVAARSLVAHKSWLRTLLRPLFPSYVRHAEELDAGPGSYDTYGFRVPAVVVSPFARPDYVLSDVFDHTSILKLVEEKWNLPALTRRDAAAVSPVGALDLHAPPAFLTPPQLPAPTLAFGSWQRQSNAAQDGDDLAEDLRLITGDRRVSRVMRHQPDVLG